MIKVSTSIPKILGKLYGFPKQFEKSRASLRKKISKFLGHLPSEQIFYRNIPLGTPDKFLCAGCSACYVGETNRDTSPARIREHLFSDKHSHTLKHLRSS